MLVSGGTSVLDSVFGDRDLRCLISMWNLTRCRILTISIYPGGRISLRRTGSSVGWKSGWNWYFIHSLRDGNCYYFLATLTAARLGHVHGHLAVSYTGTETSTGLSSRGIYSSGWGNWD